MEQEYYWIETSFPLFGFWGTVFKFWSEVKRIKGEILHYKEYRIFKILNKNRIRDSA